MIGQEMNTGTLIAQDGILVLFAEVSYEKQIMHKKHLAQVKFLPPSKNMQESTQTTEKEFIKACQDLQWTHDPKTPHRSETTGIAGRSAFRVRESTATAMVESDRPEEWWDCEMECYLRGRTCTTTWPTTKKRLGVTFVGRLMSFGVLVRFGKKMSPGIFMDCCLTCVARMVR